MEDFNHYNLLAGCINLFEKYILQIAHKRLLKKLNQGHPWCLDIYHLKYCMSPLNLIKTFFEIYTIQIVIIRFIKNISLHQLFS